MNSDDFFQEMCKEALEDLTSGKHGTWREIDTNTLFLACVGMVMNHLRHSIVRPLWFFVSAVAAGVVWFIISSVFRIG